jgi:CheY-like chemotaxis protein
MMTSSSELSIILAEDNDGHAALIERNLARAGIRARLVRVRSGLELLAQLEGANFHPDQRLLILLDIRMPNMDGIEALQHLKSDKRTATVPVYVLTTSDDPREAQQCFELGCNAFITKPIDYDEFMETIRRLGQFVQISTLPAGFSSVQ